jgi:CubicO group peptidase (beta-lactamase class C family)
MNDTYVFNMTDSARAMPSFDWRGRLEKLTFLDTGFGDKNIYSTPEDLLKWDQALYTNQVFNAKTLEAAYTPYSNEKPGIRNYGYGWRMNVYPDGRKVIYHNGWWHGNNTVFIRMIQDSVTIIVLGNKYNRAIYQAKKMAEIFDPSFVIEDEEKPGNVKEFNVTDENADSVVLKKSVPINHRKYKTKPRSKRKASARPHRRVKKRK